MGLGLLKPPRKPFLPVRPQPSFWTSVPLNEAKNFSMPLIFGGGGGAGGGGGGDSRLPASYHDWTGLVGGCARTGRRVEHRTHFVQGYVSFLL